MAEALSSSLSLAEQRITLIESYFVMILLEEVNFFKISSQASNPFIMGISISINIKLNI